MLIIPSHMSLKMKSNCNVYFSYIERLTEDIMISAALAAENYPRYIILSYNEQLLSELSDFINENASNPVPFELIKIPNIFFPNTIKDFIQEISGLNDVNFYEHDLVSNISHEIKGIRKVLGEQELIKLLKSERYDLALDFLILKNISFNAANSLINSHKVLMNVTSEVMRFHNGDSFFSDVDNFSKQYWSDLECLKLSEFIELINRLKLYTKSDFIVLNDYVLKKVIELKGFVNIIPSDASDVNILTSRNNFNHDAFPSIFKFISVVHFESALRIKDGKKSSLSFLHSIRALETYLEGFLIYKNKAIIGDCNQVLDGKQKVIKDVFLLNGRQVNGISKKLNAVIELKGLEGSAISNEIREVIRIRNKMTLTHGDVKICEKIASATILRVMNIIDELEPKNQVSGFEWTTIRKKVHDILAIDFESIGYDLLNKHFNSDSRLK